MTRFKYHIVQQRVILPYPQGEQRIPASKSFALALARCRKALLKLQHEAKQCDALRVPFLFVPILALLLCCFGSNVLGFFRGDLHVFSLQVNTAPALPAFVQNR